MDESGEQFVAYFLPTEETLTKRKADLDVNRDYMDDEVYDYRMAREYNWNVKSKATKGYEENYFFVIREEGVYYNELETRVRLNKRRTRGPHQQLNTKLCVKHIELAQSDYKFQRNRERELEALAEDEEEDEEKTDDEEKVRKNQDEKESDTHSDAQTEDEKNKSDEDKSEDEKVERKPTRGKRLDSDFSSSDDEKRKSDKSSSKGSASEESDGSDL